MAKLCSTDYAVVELNNVAAVRTGEIVSQYELEVPQIENGMLVVANHAKGTVALPQGATDTVYLHATVEKLYDGEGRNKFVVKQGSFLPRLYKLGMGDTFETNAVEHDKSSITELQQAITETKGFGVPSTTGNIKFEENQTPSAAVELKAVAVVVLPNGEYGIKWRVVKAVA